MAKKTVIAKVPLTHARHRTAIGEKLEMDERDANILIKNGQAVAAGGIDGDDEDEPLPKIADLEDALDGLSADEIRAMQARDDRSTAVPIYEAALEALEEDEDEE